MASGTRSRKNIRTFGPTENQAPSSCPGPSNKRKFERIAKKKSTSPLRRSERIVALGSSSLKKSNTKSTLPRKKEDSSPKLLVVTEEKSKDNCVDTKISMLRTKKKLTARSYRSYLNPKPKILKRPEAAVGSTSGSRDLEPKDERKSPVSGCSGSSLQSSPVGVTNKETECGSVGGDKLGEGDRYNECQLGRAEVSFPELVDSAVGEMSSVDFDLENRCTLGSPKSTEMTASVDFDSPTRRRNNEISSGETFAARTTSSSSFKSENENMKRCTSCRKPQSMMHNDTQDPKMCSCNVETMNTLSIPSMEEISLAVQTDTDSNACAGCKNPGPLVCCGGKDCKSRYHLSCIEPPLQDMPLGVWLCLSCVKMKMEAGVYSVSHGMESVWDVKEDIHNGKQYLVKYKDLAHVHNRWIPESQMLVECPGLVAKYNGKRHKEKVIRWKPEWTEPHRLLQKRLVMPLKERNEKSPVHGNVNSYEWLVKWKGLGYEHATWEFGSSPFLCSSEAILLMKDYERRHEEAKKTFNPVRTKKDPQVKNYPFYKLSKLPDVFLPEFDNDHLSSINRLREFWHKSQNAILIDDQEHIIRTILFILALRSHTCRPFLIISTVTCLPVWEAEFSRLAPSVNLVVYGGNRDARKWIQNVEFYDEGGCIMFQVLLSNVNAIVEDFDFLGCIGWEAIVVDECQNSRISKHLEKIKHLSADFRLLIKSDQLKDNIAEYINLLSFLDSGGKEDCFGSPRFDSKNAVDDLSILKDRLARFGVYEGRPEKFLEFWVPVRLSNVQLEQYCATLLSNLLALRSSSKVDHVGALRDILISTRKSCDHPYIVEPQLHASLTSNLPMEERLDVDINASGKLLLLYKVLLEMKNRGLRVLILFQSTGGAGKDKIGDILEDVLRLKFGPDRYERVDGGLTNSKKLAAMNMFNDKANGRLFFLIENRACLPSTKLSSVDCVIIFNSDWNPLNDLRALQRISIESQFEHVKVFRLYSSFTLEEKVLIFGKQEMILDSNIQTIIPTVSHSLLSWGASYLFSKLDEFHQHDKLISSFEVSTDKLSVDAVVLDLLKQLPDKAEVINTSSCSILVKVQQSGASYSKDVILVGEKEGISSLHKDPHTFWSNLLEGRDPQWKYISSSAQRNRRKVQHLDRSSKVLKAENDEVKIKRRKVADAGESIYEQAWLQDKIQEAETCKDTIVPDKISLPCYSSQQTPLSSRKSAHIPNVSQNLVNVGSQEMRDSDSAVGHKNHDLKSNKPQMIQSGESENFHSSQSSLHLLLKPELSKLCEVLCLPVNVKVLAEELLEHIMKKHHVDWKPETLLQSLKISLCWRAASFLKHKVDHKESLEVAKKILNFECDEVEADSVYSKLRILKKNFSQGAARVGVLRDDNEPNSRSRSPIPGQNIPKDDYDLTYLDTNSTMSGKDFHGEIGFGHSPKPAVSDRGESKGDDTGQISCSHRCTADIILAKEHVDVPNTPAKFHKHIESLEEEILKKRVNYIDKLYSRREEELLLKQQVELSDFNIRRAEEKMKLQKAHHSELESIHLRCTDSSVKNDMIKHLNEDFCKKNSRFDDHMKFQRRKLAVMQVDARNRERQIKDHWLEETKAGRVAVSFDDIPLSSSGFTLEVLDLGQHSGACDGFGNPLPVSGLPSGEPLNNATTTGPVEFIDSTNKFSEMPVSPHSGLADAIPVETGVRTSQCNKMNEEKSAEPVGMNNGVLEAVSPGPKAAGSVIIETNDTSMVLPGILDDLACRDADDMLVENENSAYHSSNMNEVEPVEPVGTCKIPATFAPGPGEAGDMIVGTESYVEPVGIHKETVSKDAPGPGAAGDMIVITESSVEPVGAHEVTASVTTDATGPGAADDMIVITESSVEPVGAHKETASTDALGPGVACDMIVETEFRSSTVLPVEPGYMADGDLDEMLVETENSPSRCDRRNVMESVESVGTAPSDILVETGNFDFRCSNTNNVQTVEPSGTSVGSPTIGLPGFAGDMPKEIETSLSQSDAMGAPNIPNSMHADPGIEIPDSGMVLVDCEQHTVANISGDVCLTSSLQIRANDFFSADALTSYACENSALSNQGQFVSELERPNVSCEETVRGFSSPQKVLVPVINSAQVEQINHNPDVSDSVNFQVPLSTTHIPVAEQSQGSIPTSLESEKEPCYQTQCSTIQHEVSTQEPSVSAAVQVEESDQLSEPIRNLLPHSATTPERPHSEELSCTRQESCSLEQTEMPSQQQIMSADFHVEESDQLMSESIVHSLPQPAATPPEEMRSEELGNTHQTCFSFQQTEVPPQEPIIAADVHVMPSNLLDSQSILHQFPHRAATPPEGLRSEYLNSTQPEYRSHFLESLPVLNWIPPQGIHPDPLQNELLKIHKQQELLRKMQEDKKMLIKLEYEQELAKVRKKYDDILHSAEDEYIQNDKFLLKMYDDVFKYQAFAEFFKSRFVENKGGASPSLQGSRLNPLQQYLQSSRPQAAQRQASIISTPPAPATVPQRTSSAAASVRPRTQATAPASVMPSPVVRRASPAVPLGLGNQVRPRFSPTALPPRTNLRIGSDPTRSPAPHLHRFRPHQSLPHQTGAVPGQQQPPCNLGSSSSVPPPVSSFPSIHHSMAAFLGGTSRPVEPSLGAVGDPYNPNPAPSMETALAMDGLPSRSSPMLTDIELPPLSNGAVAAIARPTDVGDVVCLSDDE